MITIRRATLPEGLSALALRDHGEDLTLFVSDAIAPDRQRAAVRVALRASRRSGWRAALIPALGIFSLALGRTWLGGLARALRAHAAATATAAVLTAAAATTATIALVPHQTSPRVSAGGPHAGQPLHRGNSGPGSRPAERGSGGAHRRRPHPVATATASVSTRHQAPSPSPTHPTPQPSPRPTHRSPTPTPKPTHSPKPTPKPSSSGSGGTCVWLLGIKVCV